MKKIPSLFKRDFDGNPRLVLPVYNEGVEWVLLGEGIPFRKWDGTAVLIQDGGLYKRYDAKNGKTPPDGFIPAQEPDPNTGHWPGWLPCYRSNKGDKYIWEAHDNTHNIDPNSLFDGTYEAIGPKINGNKDRHANHWLKRHSCVKWDEVPTDFEGLKNYFQVRMIEGIVWHHNTGDGRMVKIKRSDFGYPW